MCASWDSHLPLELRLTAVVGHGMNRTELAANARLTSYFVQDLNKDPRLLSLPAESFDAVRAHFFSSNVISVSDSKAPLERSLSHHQHHQLLAKVHVTSILTV